MVMKNTFDPFYKLWTMCSDYEENTSTWLTGPFLELDSKTIETEVNNWWRQSLKMSKALRDDAPTSADVAKELRDRTTSFRKNLPVIQRLASPALRDRHWDQLSESIGQQVEPDDELTLQQLLEMGITDHIEAIEEVCVIAEKEYSLEKNLKLMQQEWEPVELDTFPYKVSHVSIILFIGFSILFFCFVRDICCNTQPIHERHEHVSLINPDPFTIGYGHTPSAWHRRYYYAVGRPNRQGADDAGQSLHQTYRNRMPKVGEENAVCAEPD
jgi:hypothetical protein